MDKTLAVIITAVMLTGCASYKCEVDRNGNAISYSANTRAVATIAVNADGSYTITHDSTKETMWGRVRATVSKLANYLGRTLDRVGVEAK